MIRYRSGALRNILAGLGPVLMLLSCCRFSTCYAIDESLLPLSTTDQLVVMSRETRQSRKVSGVIEDISGQVIVLRRSAADVDVFTLRDVIRIDFRRSVEFDNGLRQLRKRQFRSAINSLKSAAATEPREWAVREIHAMLARALVGDRQYDDAVATVEAIVASDPATRHVVELPLVWDERLPVDARISLAAAELESESIVRKLTTASARLHEPMDQSECIAVLKDLTGSANPRLAKLAETQLWRLKLFSPQSLNSSELDVWHKQISRLDRRTRSGPEFLCGRAHSLLREHDLAATSLLWMPLVEPLDPETTRASLKEAVTALESSGRRLEADVIRTMDTAFVAED